MRWIGFATVGVALASGVALAQSGVADGFESTVDETGAISLPDVDFRADWTMLGTYSIAGEEGAEGLHVVYTQPGVAQFYRDTGSFPDGAVLVKELLGTTTEELTTGTVSYAADPSGWFVMVKAATPRFEDNPLWGDGWGWAYFDAEDRTTTQTMDYKAECKGCHIPARKTDWVYVRGYPVLVSR
jgi:hypothetical protein